jgi:hypothetical protein
MARFAAIALANVACIFTLIAVHELGHFLAGWLGGIPLRAMRVRLLTFPQHVALYDEAGWIAPFDLERYLGVMQKHLGDGARLFLYTAGGMIFETIVAVATTLGAKAAGWDGLAVMVAGQSACLFVIYLFVMDLPMALRRGYPWGDVSGLWFIARGPTVLLVVAMLAIRAWLVWHAIA